MGTLKLAFVLEAVDKATSKVRAVNEAIAKSVDRITEPVRRVRASFNALAAESGLEKVKDGLSGVIDKIRSLPLVAAISVGGAIAAIHRNVDGLDRTVDLTKKLAMTTAEFQRLAYAAGLSGSSEEEMAQALQFLSRNMAEAITGSKEAQLWFARMGIPLARLKQMRVNEVFEAIADKFHSVGDEGQNAVKKVLAVTSLMGRGGGEMVQMLNQGSAGIRKLKAEADGMGVTLNEDSAHAIKEFSDNLKRMHASVAGILNVITIATLPAIDAMVQRFTSLNKASRQEIGEKLSRFITAFVTAMPKVLMSLGQISKAVLLLIGLADMAAQFFGGWDNVLVGLAALLGGKVLWGMAMFAQSLFTLGSAIALTPFGWFLLAVTGIALAAYQVYKHWEPIKTFFVELWDGVKAAFTSAYDWIAEKIGALVELGRAAGRLLGVVMGGGIGTGGGTMLGSNPMGDPVPEISSGVGRAEVGGTIRIQIDQDGRARVAALKSDNRNVNLDVYSGLVLGD